MDSKKESIRRVSKSANLFELLKFHEVFFVHINGREIVFTKYEDVANIVFTKLIAKI
jgi:hypothetical protein